VRRHTVRRPRLALGDGAATRVGFFGPAHPCLEVEKAHSLQASTEIRFKLVGIDARFEGCLQLLNCYRIHRFARVPKRASTPSFVVLIIGNSRVESLGHVGHLEREPLK